jgi:hypothetical protein
MRGLRERVESGAVLYAAMCAASRIKRDNTAMIFADGGW